MENTDKLIKKVVRDGVMALKIDELHAAFNGECTIKKICDGQFVIAIPVLGGGILQLQMNEKGQVYKVENNSDRSLSLFKHSIIK